MIQITVSGAGIPREKLEKAAGKIVAGARQALYKNALVAQRSLATYPPQPSRTRAQTFNTYVRGVGSFPKSAFNTATGKTRPGARKGRYGAVRYTSQRLGTQWYVAHGIDRNEASVVIGNRATYAPFVQARDGVGGNAKLHQQLYHRATGWLTLEDALERQMPQIKADIRAAIRDITGR